MGYIKNSLVTFLNKRHYYLIKTYAYYRRDFWGILRLKRLYKYKKIIYNILKYKHKFYGVILYKVYHGLKFFNKKINYQRNLFFFKKRVKFFYGNLRDSYMGKLGLLVKKKFGILINYFYSLLERRVDVLLYRALYTFTVRFSHKFIDKKLVFINSKCVFFYGTIFLIGDFLRLRFKTIIYPSFFFRYIPSRNVKTFRYRMSLFFLIKKMFLNWFFFSDFFSAFLPLFVRLRRKKKKVLRVTTKHILNNKFRLIIFRALYRLPLKFLRRIYVAYFLVKRKKGRRIIKRSRKYYHKYTVYLNKVGYPYYFIYVYSQFIRILLKLRWYRKRKKLALYLYYYTLYGLTNLRLKFRKFFFFLKPRVYNRVFSYNLTKVRSKIKNVKNYRLWKFSYSVYVFLKKMKNFFFIYKGYLSHLEVNYKIHIILLVSLPTIDSVTYPFSICKLTFFDYFRRRAYF